MTDLTIDLPDDLHDRILSLAATSEFDVDQMSTVDIWGKMKGGNYGH